MSRPSVRSGQRWRACEGIVPDIHIADHAQDVDGWIVTSAGRDATILLTEHIVTNFVLIEDPRSV